MNEQFAPAVKQEQYRGREMWVVDCRRWGEAVKKMGHPQRRRFANEKDAEAWVRQLIRDEATGYRPSPFKKNRGPSETSTPRAA